MFQIPNFTKNIDFNQEIFPFLKKKDIIFVNVFHEIYNTYIFTVETVQLCTRQ